jgi:hypothetical protein
MHTMRTAQVMLVLFALTACGGTKEAAKDTTAAAPAPAPAMAAGPKITDFAGTWQMQSTLAGTPKPVPSTLVGSADGATWTVSLEGRPNIAVTASMVGDSLISQTAEYESVLRKGVMVSVRTASVLKDGAITGNVVATYKTPKGEEKVMGTVTGTKAPAK